MRHTKYQMSRWHAPHKKHQDEIIMTTIKFAELPSFIEGKWTDYQREPVKFIYTYTGWNKTVNWLNQSEEVWMRPFLSKWLGVVMAVGEEIFDSDSEFTTFGSGIPLNPNMIPLLRQIAKLFAYRIENGPGTPIINAFKYMSEMASVIPIFRNQNFLKSIKKEYDDMLDTGLYFKDWVKRVKNKVDNTWGYDEDDDDVRKYRTGRLEMDFHWGINVKNVNGYYFEQSGHHYRQYKDERVMMGTDLFDAIIIGLDFYNHSERYTLNPEWDHD